MANRPDDEEEKLNRYGDELAALDVLKAPEPRPGLEARIWARVSGELAQQPGAPGRSSARFAWPRFALLAGGAAAIVVASFVAGRLSGPEAAPAGAELASLEALVPLAPDARDRLLMAALAAHLDSSERVLIELANQPAASLTDERRFAEALLASNRLYRRAAERAGQRRAAALLAELEPLFAELAHAPADGASTGAVAAVRDRLDSQDLLFKVRITRNNL